MKRIIVVFIVLIGLIWTYSSSLIGVDNTTKEYLNQLDIALETNGYASSYFVISGRRWKIDNYLLNKFGGAASQSKHLAGQAIDIIVLDVNQDGMSDDKDVDIIYHLLDKSIMKGKGGLGSYKHEKGFFNAQMIHFDSRGTRARWNR